MPSGSINLSTITVNKAESKVLNKSLTLQSCQEHSKWEQEWNLLILRHMLFPRASRLQKLASFILLKHFIGSVSRVQGRVARSMVSANHWLSGIKTWYLTWVSANHASSNSPQIPRLNNENRLTGAMFSFPHRFLLLPILGTPVRQHGYRPI